MSRWDDSAWLLHGGEPSPPSRVVVAVHAWRERLPMGWRPYGCWFSTAHLRGTGSLLAGPIRIGIKVLGAEF